MQPDETLARRTSSRSYLVSSSCCPNPLDPCLLFYDYRVRSPCCSAACTILLHKAITTVCELIPLPNILTSFCWLCKLLTCLVRSARISQMLHSQDRKHGQSSWNHKGGEQGGRIRGQRCRRRCVCEDTLALQSYQEEDCHHANDAAPHGRNYGERGHCRRTALRLKSIDH
jgi:hypothetical protein